MKVKFEDFLNESVSPNVYHFTYINNLLNILKTNALYTTPVIGTQADFEKNKGKFYYFTVQRSRHGKIGYAYSTSDRNMKVCLNINGQKLNQNFKGTPVDYWNSMKDPNDLSGHPQDRMNMVTRFNELEDRIVTDKNTIEPATKYIEEIHVLIEDSVEKSYKLYQVDEQAKQLNIPIYYYKEEKYFDNQFKKKSIPFNELDIGKEEENTEKRYKFPFDLYAFYIYNDKENEKELFEYLKKNDELKEFLEGRDATLQQYLDKIKDRVKEFIRSYFLDTNREDRHKSFIRFIENEIDAIKRSPKENHRYIIKKIVEDMKQHNLKTISEYVKYKIK